ANQTQTLFIRDLALDPEIKFPKYAVKQIFSGSIIAIICLISVYSLITLSWNEAEIAFVVGVAVAISIFVANLSALIVPYVLFIFKKDPAIGSGPFTTTLQDILNIVIYFWVALILL